MCRNVPGSPVDQRRTKLGYLWDMENRENTGNLIWEYKDFCFGSRKFREKSGNFQLLHKIQTPNREDEKGPA